MSDKPKTSADWIAHFIVGGVLGAAAATFVKYYGVAELNRVAQQLGYSGPPLSERSQAGKQVVFLQRAPDARFRQ